MKKRPINLYLDTSDFYELYKEDVREDLIPLKNYLIEKVKSGDVVIGYSYPIIFEVLQNSDEKHREDRLKRARFLKLICGENAHPHPVDLLKGHRFPNQGIWMPHSTVDVFSPQNLRSLLSIRQKKTAKEREGLSRAQRRSAQSRRGLKKLLQEAPRLTIRKDMFEDIPVSDDFINSRYIERYWRGEISINTVSHALKKWIHDPEVFFQIWYEYSGLKNPLHGLVTEKYNEISEKLSKAISAIKNARNTYKSVKKSRSAYYDELRKVELPSTLKSSLSLPKLPPFELTLPKIDWTSIFGEDRGQHFTWYMEEVITERHQPQPSDLVDLLHLLYLNDVDLFRCDRKMSNLMINIDKNNIGKIISNRLEIPDKIENLLKD
ncbi:hypothetical protein [Agrobacterium tumefaciens]|uniref:hypothetical protein n=1 Tax=Agrobacterium tumefaciens TaxID=358 RepID=UPI0015730B00|nr:hypothetical protein [Agrobacterium tumefaciens]NSX90845.1 hypothetical protein [Agrobacterium tumefaciens]